MNPSFYTSFANVFFRKPDGFRVAVEAVCFKSSISSNGSNCLCTSICPDRCRNTIPAFRCKVAVQAGGNVHCFKGCLNQQRTATAERVTDDTILLDPCQVNNASGKGFLDGGSVGVSPVSSLMQSNTIQELRDQLQAAQLQLGTLSQTNTIIGTLRPTPMPAYITCSPYQSEQYNCGAYGGCCGR